MSRKSKTDLLVRQRFQNPLPPPSFPPKLLTIKTDPARYATYDFLLPLSMEREVPMIVDAEGGMHLDQNVVPGYWDSADGRPPTMVPDLSLHAPDLDDEDLELLVDPPGANQAAAGIMPSTSGANMDLVGSGRLGPHNTRSPAGALDKRKKDVIWIKRAEYAVASEASNVAKKEALAREMMAARTSSKQEIQTPEQQVEAIINTFSALDIPLADVKHPTKPHLQAVESFEILPDEQIWANQYALFKFADNPNDRRGAVSSQPIASSSSSSANMGFIRPLQSEADDSGSNRVAYFVPDDEEAAINYAQRRQKAPNADQQLLDDALVDEETNGTADQDAPSEYGFRFVRDYDAIQRETNKEFIFVLEEKGQQPKSEDENEPVSQRPQGAYYVPLVGHTLLRKRRARKGEVANDYSDLGLDFWGGILVSVGGKEVFPADEVEARRQELDSIRVPQDVQSTAIVETQGDSIPESQETKPSKNGHTDDAMQ